METAETYRPQDLDSSVALTRLRKFHGSNHLRAWSPYFSHAYKTIALHPGSAEASYICIINPVDNRPYTARILAQPFGSRRSPSNWGRVVKFIQFVARKMLHLAVGAFVADVYCAEGAAIAKSGPWAFKHLCRLLGFVTSDKKDQAPSISLALLGAEISLSRDAIRAQASTQRVLKIQGHIAHALHLNCLPLAAARKLRGELGFYTSLLMGKLGSGAMAPLPLNSTTHAQPDY